MGAGTQAGPQVESSSTTVADLHDEAAAGTPGLSAPGTDQHGFVAHSHGGNVAFLATHGGLTIGELVLLSCPVRIPQYVPDFAQTNKVVSIRVHLDLVILVDGAGQHFPFPQIQEHVLPIWFDHFATHDPAVWQEHNVPGML